MEYSDKMVYQVESYLSFLFNSSCILVVVHQLWDINMDSGPVATFQVHEHLRPKLCDLYENDSIFDKFECCFSGDGLRVATGSYRCLSSLTRAVRREKIQLSCTTPYFLHGSATGAENQGVDANGNSLDFTTKLLHLAWHPTENSIACAAANSLYMYYA
ncbi:hypothetical protein BHM03_00014279 [Ensete ventricosum]|nr:hypothetical protein BHM03_00014279 [Ensete ventricosum]